MQILGVLFPVAAGMGLLLGIVNLLMWHRMPDRQEFLFACFMGLAAASIALTENSFLSPVTPEAYQFNLEIQNIAVAVMLISMVWFVVARMNAGRRWLAWACTAGWAASAVISLLGPGNITFSSIETVQTTITDWGESYSQPVGSANPLVVLPNLTTFLIMGFVADACIAAIRNGRTRDAVRVGGPILLFIVVAGIHTPLVDAGIFQMPYMISLFFLAIGLCLALVLVDDVARSAVLNSELFVERQRWNTLMENVQLAVVRIDRQGRIAYANPFFEHVTERSLPDLQGLAPADLLLGDDSVDVGPLVRQEDDWTSRSQIRRRIVTASGGQRELIWFSVALKDHDGTPDGVIAFGQDVTDLLAAQAERDATIKEMERLTRAMTMGELASTLVHELSQPLAAVLSNTQTLEILRAASDQEPDETDEIVQDILRDTRRARDLMNRVRGYMFDEAPRREVFDLGPAIGEVAGILLPEAKRRSVEVRTIPPPEPVAIMAARLELQQIFMNLILNAVQAADGMERPLVLVSWAADGADTAVIVVEDNGTGIPQEKLETIFEPFVSSKSEGTGIGLAVSRRIVQRHGGSIVAGASPVHGGARIEVRLPRDVETEVRAIG